MHDEKKFQKESENPRSNVGQVVKCKNGKVSKMEIATVARYPLAVNHGVEEWKGFHPPLDDDEVVQIVENA